MGSFGSFRMEHHGAATMDQGGQGSQQNQLRLFADQRGEAGGSLSSGQAPTGGAGLPADRAEGLVPLTKQFVNSLTGLDCKIDRTWDGQPVDHEPYTFHMEWVFQRRANKAHKRAVKVFLQGPLMDEPEPPESLGGICPNLWDYEVFELFFANEHQQYLEVEVGPHGHWLCLLHNGVRKAFNKGAELELEIQNTFEGNNWQSSFEIPLAYFPPNVTKFNAYKIHGYPEQRQYEAVFPVTDGSFAEPDFHRLEFFGKLDKAKIIPEGFNERIFDDLLIGDLWTRELFPNKLIPPPPPPRPKY